MRAPPFLRDERGAGAAEFALVLPIALLFLFGLIDVGRYAWSLNQLEKAAQMGARFAVVTNVIPGGLNAATYVGNNACNGGIALVAGETVCAAALGSLSCSSSSCTCATSPCPPVGTFDTAAFNNILARMRVFAPYLGGGNVLVSYSGSGVGYAGDPGIDVAPLVTIQVQNVQFRPMLLSLFGGTVPYPAIRRSLVLEDGLGTKAD